MPWNATKHITVAATVVATTLVWLEPANAQIKSIPKGVATKFIAGAEMVTLHVPVKVQNLLPGVGVQIKCFVSDASNVLGTQQLKIPLQSGAFNKTLTLVVTPDSDKSFSSATRYACQLGLWKGSIFADINLIKSGPPTGKPHLDWLRAKPGTTLKVIVSGLLPK